MPISYLNLHPQIQKYSQSAALWHLSQQEKLKSALDILMAVAKDPRLLKSRLEKLIIDQGRNLRFATLGKEAINSSIELSDKATPPCTLLAADGSQINPDPHAAIFYALINIGVFQLDQSKMQVPDHVTGF